MKIVPYDKKYKESFIALNTDWMQKMFGEVEEADQVVFDSVDSLVEEGGQVFFALDDTDMPMACCMILHYGEGIWEVCKFAARGQYTGTGAGNACLESCIEHAKKNGAKRIFVVSNTKCEAALHLYKKNGFKEVSFNRSKLSLRRANITLELYLE